MRNSHGARGVDSESHSPVGSAPRSPQSVGADGSAHSAVFTGATSFQGQVCERGAAQCGHSSVEQDSELLCGWGALRPRALQVFITPRWALFFLSVASFLQGFLINGLISIVLTSIERRFGLSSSQTGLIVSFYDIASCICVPFVSYFGGNGHKPRWLGWGVAIMGLGSLLFALPHFTTPPYQVAVPKRSDLCSSNSTHFSQSQASDGLSLYFYVFVAAQLLHGIGATPLFTLGYTFLEENVKSDNAPVYMGLFYTATLLGPLVGMLLGGFFLSIYSEITVETELTPASPVWVGAWWIGFILGGALCLPVAFVILGLPKKLPGSQDAAASCQSEIHQDKDGQHSSASNPQFVKLLKDMPRSFLLLLRIPTFIFLCLAVTAVNGQSAAGSAFLIKFFESQFGISSSDAAMLYSVLIGPSALGAVLGSFFIKRFKLKCRGIIRFCIACTLVGLILSFVYLIHCPNASMAGVTVPYSSGRLDVFQEDWVQKLPQLNSYRSVQEVELTAHCNKNCSCNRQLFSPVCGADDVMYFSPCYAGCSSINLTGSGQVFTDCSCVGANVSWGQEGSAVAGRCAHYCSYFAVFMTLYLLASLCGGLYTIPPITATLRCVPQRQKSFALGIQWIVVRVLGAIPGPIVYGSLLDQACLLRQSEGHGSCYVYENSQMSHFTLLNTTVYRVAGVVFFILALVFLKAPAEPAPISPENTDSGAEDTQNQKTLPGGGARVTHQTRL